MLWLHGRLPEVPQTQYDSTEYRFADGLPWKGLAPDKEVWYRVFDIRRYARIPTFENCFIRVFHQPIQVTTDSGVYTMSPHSMGQFGWSRTDLKIEAMDDVARVVIIQHLRCKGTRRIQDKVYSLRDVPVRTSRTGVQHKALLGQTRLKYSNWDLSYDFVQLGEIQRHSHRFTGAIVLQTEGTAIWYFAHETKDRSRFHSIKSQPGTWLFIPPNVLHWAELQFESDVAYVDSVKNPSGKGDYIL